jgi:hypothetical protein
MQLNVSLGMMPMPKPKHPLLSHNINLSEVLLDHMYVGFSSSSSGNLGYFVLGCSFKVNGEHAQLNYSKLPEINTIKIFPNDGYSAMSFSRLSPSFYFLVTLVPGMLILTMVITIAVRRYYKYREIREDWELEFGPHRFSYKNLFHATDGFKDKQLLGAGGFGKVYKGGLKSSKLEVAVKVMFHDSKQGMKEFIAEVVSMGRLHIVILCNYLGIVAGKANCY